MSDAPEKEVIDALIKAGRQYQPGADIYTGGLGVSAVAMLGRTVDRRAQMAVTAGWPDVGRA